MSFAAFMRRRLEIIRSVFAKYIATYLHLLLYSPWRAGVLVVSVVVITVLVTAAGVPSFSNATMSATARTEVLSFKLGRNEVLDWPLRTGEFASFGPVDGFSCNSQAEDDLFFACKAPEGLSLHVENWAEVTVVVIPQEVLGETASGPRLSIEVTPMQEPREALERSDALFGCVKPIGESASESYRPTSVELRNARDEVVYVADGPFAFELSNSSDWRVPLDVYNLLLGESLLSGVSWQPIVTEGEVRLFASSSFAWWRPLSRYLVFEDTLDPADVVKIPLGGCWGDRLLGVVSYDDSGVIDLTVHTAATEVLVTRLGGQHAIRISMWDILAGQPVWLAVLALFVWAVMILDYTKDENTSQKTAEFIQNQNKSRSK